jgi:hypothetical protein
MIEIGIVGRFLVGFAIAPREDDVSAITGTMISSISAVEI